MAQSVLEILIRVKDKASQELAKVDKGFDKISKSAKNAGLNMEVITDGFLAIGKTAFGAAVAAGLAIGKIVNDTVEYGKAVDDLSRSLGTSTEEASKLIQVADDVRISYDQLKTSFRIALREGFLPNIEGLKQMAAEYQKLPSPIEKAQYALKNFGRSGMEMQKMLELSPEKIDEMAASAEAAGLVLDKEAVEATKEFWREVDTLNDSLEGLKTTLGLGVIPVLIEYLDLLNQRVDQEMAISRVEEKIEKVTNKATDAFNHYKMTNAEARKVFQDSTAVMRKFMLGQIDEEQAMRQIDVIAKEHNITLQESFLWGNKVAQSTADLTEETDKEIVVFDDLTAYQNEIAAGYQEMGMAAEDAKQAAIDATVATGEALQNLILAKRELDKARTERFFDVDMDFGKTAAEAIKAIDFRALGGDAGNDLVESIKQAFVTGAITEPEADAYLEKVIVAAAGIQVTLGEVDAETAVDDLSEQLKKPVEEVKPLLEAELNKPLDLAAFQQALEAQFQALEDRRNMLIGAGEFEPNKVEITVDPQDAARMKIEALYLQLDNMTKEPWVVDVVVNKPDVGGGGGGTGGGGGGGGRRRKQYGGYVSPMTPYLVGERGPELFVPNAAGNIVPNNRLRGGGGARGDVYVTQHFHSAGAAALGMAMVDEYSGRRLDSSMGG